MIEPIIIVFAFLAICALIYEAKTTFK